MSDEENNKIQRAIQLLNTIEVKGRSNVIAMALAMDILEKITIPSESDFSDS